MWKISVLGLSYDLRVLIGLLVLSVVLGVLNNMRVYEEQQVPWLGADYSTEESEG